MNKTLLLLAPALLLASCQHEAPQPPPAKPKPAPVAAKPAEEVAEEVEEKKPERIEVPKGDVNPLDIPGKKREGYKNPYPKGSYEYFVAKPSYPRTMAVFEDSELLNRISAATSKLIICIPQQRARLYIEGKVAYDWPVSTGGDGHETPTGVFRILEKEKNHHSNRYGKFVSSKGKVTNSNADLANGTPKGMSFCPASMPNWNRLTLDGVGLHGGRVVAGQRLSHGCIRTPYDVAAKFYEYSVVGLPVYITRAVEDYNNNGAVKPIDVKYRPKPGNDYTDTVPAPSKQ